MKIFIKLYTIIFFLSLNINLNVTSSFLSSSRTELELSDLLTGDFLEDFDFENDFSFENNGTQQSKVKKLEVYQNPTENINVDNIKKEHANSRNNFLPIKKKIVKNAVTKSLTHKALSQKFVEVIPILRVLSSQQKIALSSLISAQISAKPGTELKLSQVRSIFGNNQKLILPLVLDIANMVRNAAKSVLSNSNDLLVNDENKKSASVSTSDLLSITSIENSFGRRIFQPTSSMNNIISDNYNTGVMDEDNYYGEIMDPIIINNELYDTHNQQNKGHINRTDYKMNTKI